MYFYLLTVESSSQSGPHLQVLPPVPVSNLIERAKGLLMPMAGDELELRLPDGRIQHALVGHFGIEVLHSEEGHFYTICAPSLVTVSADAPRPRRRWSP